MGRKCSGFQVSTLNLFALRYFTQVVYSFITCLGPTIFSLSISKLEECESAVNDDPIYFGISCIQGILDQQEVSVEHSTDIARLKSEVSTHISFGDNTDVIVVWNATILTMEHGDKDMDLIKKGAMIVRGGVIAEVGKLDDMTIPNGATIIDVHGGE
jgi:hypothetical protein